MSEQEIIARGYTVSVRPPADAADGYHVVYTPRGRPDGVFQALGNGAGALPAPTPLEAVAQLKNGQEVAVRWVSAPGQPEVRRDVLERDAENRVRLLDGWLGRLSTLLNDVETWVKALGWSTRRIEKPMEDSQIGRYKAPSLLMQEGTDRVLLEPVARSAPGAEGVVDLYLMPAYDDIASLYFSDGSWALHYLFPGAGGATAQEAPAKSLSSTTLEEVLREMREHAA
jgi:hypothetical protein